MDIISSTNVSSQEELLNRLRDNGLTVAQSTISRDIKELSLLKTMIEDGSIVYKKVSKAVFNESLEEKVGELLSKEVKNIVCANNIVVIKTQSGMAMGVATVIDEMNYEEVLGSIAGDDTIFCVTEECERAKDFKKRLESI
jgi:transcriptional regulator of arginine metabolism